MELRCATKLHGVLEGDVVEVKCVSRFCGHAPGVVVLHRFNTVTGELVETLQFKNPRKDKANAPRNPAAVRSA